MADPSGSGAAGGGGGNSTPGGSTPGSGTSTPRAIASLAKKQGDVTRLGTQKLKFVPTLPIRRKKEDVKQEPPTPSSSSKSRGRGLTPGTSSSSRGITRGRGRGTPSTTSTRPPLQEMTASGPFAMGPALAGSSSSRRIAAPRSNFTPVMVGPPGGVGELGKGLTGNAGILLGGRRDGGGVGEQKKGEDGKGKGKEKEEDDQEVYSDPDEGVEIVDMENVRNMDWMAPESLRKEKGRNRKKGVKREVKDEKMKGVTKDEIMDVDEVQGTPTEEVNLANAVHLSDSEDEEEIEDITEDFALSLDEIDTDTFTRQERLYFFQFPHPFPTFQSKQTTPPPSSSSIETKQEPSTSTPGGPQSSSSKKVSFTEDTKPPAATSRSATPSLTGKGGQQAQKEGEDKKKNENEVKVDGIVGQLEVYRSGAVKMRFGNGIVYDIVAATQPSFLQHAVYLDTQNKNLCVLGEVNRRFVASPDIGVLLSAMEAREKEDIENMLDDAGLIRMDTT